MPCAVPPQQFSAEINNLALQKREGSGPLPLERGLLSAPGGSFSPDRQKKSSDKQHQLIKATPVMGHKVVQLDRDRL
jgi:hypothetical protein